MGPHAIKGAFERSPGSAYRSPEPHRKGMSDWPLGQATECAKNGWFRGSFPANPGGHSFDGMLIRGWSLDAVKRGVFSLLILCAPLPVGAVQLQTSVTGVAEAALLFRQLDGEKRVLMIGAHPDDEDTSMLAALARGYGVQTAYLSLSRGEGGQNLIGSEVNEGLGLLRTGELVAARSIDGGQQFFSRAFDFGFSKSANETFRLWPEEELVRDVTWVIRTFRPHVILSVFTGTPRDGHGQHQAAGISARRAFEVAGDSDAFPDQLELGLEPWAVSKIYQLNQFGSGSPTVVIQTGDLDPTLGRSFYQIAMASRSQHRSQDMGAAQSPGPRTSGATLLQARVPVDPRGEDGFFTGIDTTLAGLAAAARAPDELALVSHIADYRAAIAVAAELLHPGEPRRSVAALQDAVRELKAALPLAFAAPEGPGRTELVRVLQSREETASQLLLAAAGVIVDVRVGRDRMVAGEEVGVEVVVWNGGRSSISVEEVGLVLPDNWLRSDDDGGALRLAPGEIREWGFEVQVPESARASRPYFLEEGRNGALYTWPSDPSVMGRPGNPPLIIGRAVIVVDGSAALTVLRGGSHVGVDQADGEYRVPVFVVPGTTVAVEPKTLAWPRGETGPRSVAVTVAALSEAGIDGEVRLTGPPGWEIRPESQSVSIPAGGGATAFRFEVRARDEARPGRVTFQGEVRDGEQVYREGVAFVDYRHIQPAPLFQTAELSISYFPVEVARDLRVGYVMGPGDAGPQALADLGVQVEPLGPEELRSGDLDRFDTLVLGIRAYETRSDLRNSNQRVLEFARRGGTVIVQYNQYQYPAGQFAPLSVEIARPHDRVTDAQADVTLLEPDHPVLSSPNQISEDDFEGWVQERGLYFLNRWDDGFTPLLEMADPGEEPKRGSLLVTRLGEGAYVYTGLALFRQFPNGVPGAFRLLANLVSLRGSDLHPTL